MVARGCATTPMVGEVICVNHKEAWSGAWFQSHDGHPQRRGEREEERTKFKITTEAKVSLAVIAISLHHACSSGVTNG